MDDVAAAQARLRTALERIEGGVAALGAGDQGLAEALEAERAANAQIDERLRAVKAKAEASVGELTRQVESLTASLQTREAEIADLEAEVEAGRSRERRLCETNDALRQAHQALRAAAEVGVVEPDLVNGSMSAEIEALARAREADRAELDGLIAALRPLVASDGPGDAAAREAQNG